MEKMIIYKIQNLLNNKIYIGQTIFSFNERYKGGKWWNLTSNKHLKRAATKYGKENFSIEILENNISSVEELDDLERFYIKKYDCMEPKGYNISSGGESKHFYSEEQRKVFARAKRGTEFFELKNQITEEVVKIEIASDFCKQHNLSSGHITDVRKGDVLSCGPWTLPHITIRHWVLRHRDGREVKVFENQGRKFCKEQKLKERDFESLVAGHERDGWILVSFQERIGWSGKKQKARTFPKNLNTNGSFNEIIRIKDIQSGEIFHLEKKKGWITEAKRLLSKVSFSDVTLTNLCKGKIKSIKNAYELCS